MAALTVTIFSSAEPVLRTNALSAQGTAFAAITAFVGVLLRAVIESRSRS